ncbi:uncharacterized protein CDAR_124081 [Caerostris darwini]|uniref:Synaptonemal complex protein 1 n=1 Tax=Caerostris darwini TaxID=1538125 RepID=A0AAV4TM94_9ARAC|nr:uncharacterized protein CDAR_124081 [Caerostris darwini]
MPFPNCKTTYVRPLCENNEANIHQKNFTSPIQQYKISENYMKGMNEDINLKNMDEVKKVYMDNLNSVHSKLFAGVEEIQRWKTSVEMENRQKNKKIEELLQTIELQRKTILDLQLQNENLSYQLSEEIQQRSFVVKKLHSSKELCSALKKHYNTLQEHYKCRDKIEEEINLADSKRLKAIENLQNRFDKVCREHSEKVGYLNDALSSETNKALNLKDALEQQQSIFENEKKTLCSIIENCQGEITKLSEEIEEEKNKYRLVIEDKNVLKCKVQELENLTEIYASKLKDAEENLSVIQKDYEEFVESVKLKEKETKEKVSALDDIIKSLECKVNVMEIKIKEEENKNENLTNHVTTLENKKCNLEAQISEAKAELTSFGQLQIEYNALKEHVSEFSIKETYYNTALENLNTEIKKYKSEVEKPCQLCSEKDENLLKVTEEYENKIAVTMEKLQYLEESNSQLHSKMKSLEDDLEIKSEMMCIRDEKISNLESTVSTYEVQLDTLKNENINMKEDFEKEKNRVKICLECEQLTNKLNEMNISQQKTKEELHEQKIENKEIMKMLNEMESSYNDDRINKEKEIIKFQEIIRRLEDEAGVMNFKLKDLETLKCQNQTLKDEMEELKLNANTQEDLDQLRVQNKKLKNDLEGLKKLKSENKMLKNDLKDFTKLKAKYEELKNDFEDLNDLKTQNNKLIDDLEDLKSKLLTVERESLDENNKKNNSSSDQMLPNQPDEINTCTAPKASGGRSKRKTKISIQSQNKTPKTDIVDSVLVENNSKKCSQGLKDNETASTSSEDAYFKEDSKTLTSDKNKWELDSSGSDYLEIAYDKKSETFIGLTPKKTSSPILNFLGTKKTSLFNHNMKRNSLSTPENYANKLPTKKNKTELGNSMQMQPTKFSERNADFISCKENVLKKNTLMNNTPSIPADKRKINTSTPLGQRKFFKSPLSMRDKMFKKPSSQAQWSDFLKSTK